MICKGYIFIKYEGKIQPFDIPKSIQPNNFEEAIKCLDHFKQVTPGTTGYLFTLVKEENENG